MRLYILFHHVYHVYVSTFFALFHHIFICLCIQGTDAISPYWYVYVSKVLALFHHIYKSYMFMYPCFRSISPYLFCMFMYPCFHSISPYILIIYVYVSKLPALFHHTCYVFMFPCFCTISPYILIIYVMYPYYSHYFTT